MLRNNTKPANVLQALDHPVTITRFPSQRALAKKELNLSVRKLAGKIEGQMAASKDKLPWLKLATFGDAKSAKGCLRTNANVTTITGLEADYDAGRMTPEAARTRLAKAGIAALIYTTPSHTPDAPRWRVLCPFSGPFPRALRARTARILFADELDAWEATAEGDPLELAIMRTHASTLETVC